MIKIKTELKHRFNRVINIKGNDYTIDAKGITEVPEDVVPYALKEGFILDDPNAKFESLEKQEEAKQIGILLENAHKQAEQIVSDAHKEADKIIADARKQAGLILEENQVDEKEEARKALSEKTVKELLEMAVLAEIPETETKDLKKAELIEVLIKHSFDKE